MDVINASTVQQLAIAAKDKSRISGLTHCFYRYPARFSPVFAREAICGFSKPGDVVLDPYMGGGTTILEAMTQGRRAIGSDLNELAVFISRVKTTTLMEHQRLSLAHWADVVVPAISYREHNDRLSEFICSKRTHNLTLPKARAIKKLIGIAMCSLGNLHGAEAQDFARCALLNTGQWALNGRRRTTRLIEFRSRLRETVHEMLVGEASFSSAIENAPHPKLFNSNAADICTNVAMSSVDLVVTSPPYPGIHMLYHRWQVDGRRETPAPYWIAACNDGQGASFYNFADRRRGAADSYFDESLRTLRGIHRVMKHGALFIQMVSFGDPKIHLRRYLANMEEAGFAEVRMDRECGSGRHHRIWRRVPSRNWHATSKGDIHSSREVVLIHRAVH